MKSIAVMTDTNAGMTLEEAQKNDIILLPMPVLIDDKEYLENVDISQAEFFEALKNGAQVSTSQPSPAAVTGSWDEALKRYDELIYIPMSSALSGSCQSANLYAQDYGGRVKVVDNRRIAPSQRLSALDAAYLREKGWSSDQIVQKLLETALDASIYLCVDDLKYLKKGGRITPGVAMIGTVLNIKPILEIQGSKLDTHKKVRGTQAARRSMIASITEDIEKRFSDMPITMETAYTGDAGAGAEWNAHVQSLFPQYKLRMSALPLSIASHTGPGVFGVGVFRDIRAEI